MQLRTQRFFRLIVGAVTLAAVAFGLWTAISILSRGPSANRFHVWVLFKDVQGLQTGSRVVHRGMTIGEVATLELDAQASRVRTLVALNKEARDLVKTTSQFWVVRPRFTGLSAQPSGLDTLIKESYLRLRIRDQGRLLDHGEELLGLEGPPTDLAEDDLEETMVGDLIATVKLPESHGLGTGSPVRFRGQRCGEVRHVRLSAEGRGVLITFRIRRSFRALAREKSRFWVGRPVLAGSLFTGITISSLGSILQTTLVFDSPKDAGEPLSDDAIVVGLAAPPNGSKSWDGSKVQEMAAEQGAVNRGIGEHALSPWVSVRYRAIEKDTLSANDDITAQGEGVLFRNPAGELCALTARSACDGKFLVEDHWYDSLRIANERINVFLSDGRVWPARRIWVDPDGRDLAVVRLQTPVDATPAPLPDASSYLGFAAEDMSDPSPDRSPPFVLRQGAVAVGIVGHKKVKPSERSISSFARVPSDLRPPIK